MYREMTLHEARMPIASGVQHSGGWRSVNGDYVRNMRTGSTGGLESCPVPRVKVQLGREPVFADTRLDTTYLFTLDAEGKLRVECELSGDEVATRTDTILGSISPGECRAVRAGDFLVVTDSTGALYYIRWDGRLCRYIWLGEFPNLPKMSIELVNVQSRRVEIESMSFGKSSGDFRSGVPEDISSALTEMIGDAIERGRDEAKRAGWWTSPVMVRYALRLWDGTLLFLSAPQLVAPTKFIDPRRVILPATVESGKVTGIPASHLELPVFRPGISIDSTDMGVWSEIASRIEIWVSREICIEREPGGSVGFTTSGNSNTLTVIPSYPDESELANRLPESEWVCIAAWGCSDRELESTLVRPVETADMIMDADSPVANRISHAGVTCGHGGFLHLSGYRTELPVPALPQGEPGATQECVATITVRLNSLQGSRTVQAKGTVRADNGVILPLLWYPRREAESIRVGLTYPDGRRYERSWRMVSASRERAAYVPVSGVEGITLLPVDKLTEDETLVAERENEDGSVMTMKRGNPFVPECTTLYAGGNISMIEAQQSGGGAYTRQYLYLFSDTGVTVLTHDMSGRHTNCRPVSRQRISSITRVASGEYAVWMLAESGMLMRLRDSRVDTIIRGLDDKFRLGMNDRTGELLLAPEIESEVSSTMVLDISGAGMPTLSSCDNIPYKLLRAGDRLLETVPRRQGALRVWSISGREYPGSEGQRMDAEWISPPVELKRGGMSCVWLDIRGRNPDAHIEVRILSPEQPDDYTSISEDSVIWSGGLKSTNGGYYEIPLMLPVTEIMERECFRLRLRVTGIFDSIREYGVGNFENR